MANKTGKLAIELLKHFESLHDGDLTKVGLQPKLDPIGIWTEGYGHAMIDPNTKQFLKGKQNEKRANELATIHTDSQAEAALSVDMLVYEAAVRRMISPGTVIKLTDDQFGSAVSFCYNGGTHYGKGASRKPFALWSNLDRWAKGIMSNDEIQKYWENSLIKAGGVILPGLVRRRKAEAFLFVSGKNSPNFFQK